MAKVRYGRTTPGATWLGCERAGLGLRSCVRACPRGYPGRLSGAVLCGCWCSARQGHPGAFFHAGPSFQRAAEVESTLSQSPRAGMASRTSCARSFRRWNRPMTCCMVRPLPTLRSFVATTSVLTRSARKPATRFAMCSTITQPSTNDRTWSADQARQEIRSERWASVLLAASLRFGQLLTALWATLSPSSAAASARTHLRLCVRA